MQCVISMGDMIGGVINCLIDMGLYQAQCAAFYPELELGKKILKAKDGYEAKKVATKIKLSKEWEKEKPS